MENYVSPPKLWSGFRAALPHQPLRGGTESLARVPVASKTVGISCAGQWPGGGSGGAAAAGMKKRLLQSMRTGAPGSQDEGWGEGTGKFKKATTGAQWNQASDDSRFSGRCFPGTRHCSVTFLSTSPWGRYHFWPHFTERQMEAQRG